MTEFSLQTPETVSKRQVKLDIHRLMEPLSVPMDLFVLSPEEMLRQRHVANEKAEHDLTTASVVLENKPEVTDTVCFHAQQCVEKALKA